MVCDEAEFDEDFCLRNPTAIFEVLSQSTANNDRTAKFRQYRRMRSLRDYVLVDSLQILAEHWNRGENGLWTLVGEHDNFADALQVLGVTIALSDIYRRSRLLPS